MSKAKKVSLTPALRIVVFKPRYFFYLFSFVVFIVSNYLQNKKSQRNTKNQNNPHPQKIPKHVCNLIFKGRRWKPKHLGTSILIQWMSLQQKREKYVAWKQHGNPLLLIPCATRCVLLCHSCHNSLTCCGTGISTMQSSELTRSLNFWHLFFQTVPACFCLFTCHFWEELFKFH